jgi:hypothetical protein
MMVVKPFKYIMIKKSANFEQVFSVIFNIKHIKRELFFCIKIRRKLTSKAGNLFTHDLYMQENLTLCFWEFWRDFKNQLLTSWKFLSRKHCIMSFLNAVGSSEGIDSFASKNTSGI